MKKHQYRVSEVRKWILLAVTSGTIAAGNTPMVVVAEPTVAELDQKLKIIERKLEIAEESQQAKSKEAPVVTANSKDGFSLASADKAFQLKLRGYAQADGRFFLDDDNQTSVDTFLLRRARLIFDGSLGKDFEFRIAPEFGSGQAQLQDGYLDYKPSPLANLRFGRTKVPFGLERLQSSSETLFNETGLSTALTPNYDSGILLYGSSGTGLVDYALGIFNGGPDGASVDSDTNDEKDLAGRVFLSPFKNTDLAAVKGLSFGLAGTIGDQNGTTAAPGLPSIKSSGQQTIFAYKTSTNAAETAYANGARSRISPQFYYTLGSFGLLGEYVISEQEVAKSKKSSTVKDNGWQLAGSYVLTGETPSLKGVKPLRPFDLNKGSWGAVELAARVGELDIDDTAFTQGYADSKKSVTEARNVGIGLNWYLTRNTRTSLDYEVTTFNSGASTGDRPDENLLLARVQYSF